VDRRSSLREVAGLFLKLGTIAFGGPAAHVAMMEDEVVRRRGWLSREQFLDYVGATNLIPGPNSTELAIHIGHRRAGWAGLVVAGTCFIMPAALIVGGIAALYVRYGGLPAALAILAGVKPVIIAIVLQAIVRLARTAARTWFLTIIGAAAIIAIALGANELAVLAGSAVAAMLPLLAQRRAHGGPRMPSGALAIALDMPNVARPAGALAATSSAVAVGAAVGLWPLFALMAKTGAVLFGSGYVLIAFLRADFVQRLHWLSEQQLLDAIAVGQITPGPVFTTATFVGYVLAGVPGALVATVGIFLPAFVFVALSGPLVPRIRRSPLAGAALDGVNVASLGLLIVVTWTLGRSAIVNGVSLVLAIASAVLLFRYRVNAAWLVAGGAIAGLLVFLWSNR
jgi:chromate transporter